MRNFDGLADAKSAVGPLQHAGNDGQKDRARNYQRSRAEPQVKPPPMASSRTRLPR